MEAGAVQLHVTSAILAEVRDVLMRPKIQAKFPHLTPERVVVFLQKVASIAALVSDVSSAGFEIRDPDDLPYVDLAVAANAEFIISRDNDLLDLMKDSAFVERFPNLRIVDPATFLKVRTP